MPEHKKHLPIKHVDLSYTTYKVVRIQKDSDIEETTYPFKHGEVILYDPTKVVDLGIRVEDSLGVRITFWANYNVSRQEVYPNTIDLSYDISTGTGDPNNFSLSMPGKLWKKIVSIRKNDYFAALYFLFRDNLENYIKRIVLPDGRIGLFVIVPAQQIVEGEEEEMRNDRR